MTASAVMAPVIARNGAIASSNVRDFISLSLLARWTG